MSSTAEAEANHNLPARLTSFVGREREIGEVRALLGAHRLVTLVGPPGVGKTRLSVQIALVVLEAFPDGVWLAELAPLSDAELVPHAVADVLGIGEAPGRPLTATLAGYLRSRRLLLVLDNCEHLIGTCAVLAEALLRACPSLHILATSREPLAIDGELAHRVSPLRDTEAVRLFVERSRSASPSFALTERTAPVVEQICTRLDGIPLAIELAAARVRALSVEQVAARLDDRFRLLTGGSRTALPRQQTLLGAVDWSYDLLSAPEQALLRRLSVFAGGFTLEAAEGVAGQSVLDALVSLVDKSLVQVDESAEDGAWRYRLLETIRQYGQKRLIERGEHDDARSRHRDYFLTFAEEAGPRITGSGQIATLARLERELDNLRTAIAWCIEKSGHRRDDPVASAADPAHDAVLGLRLAGSIWRFWWLRSHIGEGRDWLARLLAVGPPEMRVAGRSARATALQGIANLSTYQGDWRAAIPYMAESLAICREIEDHRGIVFALQRLGYFFAHLGESERPMQFCEESVELGRRLGDSFGLALALQTSGQVARMLGRPERSARFFEESVSLLRKMNMGDVAVMANTLREQSHAVADLGDSARGLALTEEALCMSQKIGDRFGVAMSSKDIARFALFAGDADRASTRLHTAIALFRTLGNAWQISISLEILAGVLLLPSMRTPERDIVSSADTDGRSGRLLDAVRLYGWSDLMRVQNGLDPPREMRGAPERHVAWLRASLDEDAYAAAWAEGRAMSFEEVTAYALVLTAPADGAVSEQTSSPSIAAGAQRLDRQDATEDAPLTAREREVAALVARGCTNRQIAEALVLSERTVHTHVHNILGKLEGTSRAQIAAWAVKHGLADSR